MPITLSIKANTKEDNIQHQFWMKLHKLEIAAETLKVKLSKVRKLEKGFNSPSGG